MNSAKVSIIISSYNSIVTIVRCLQSLEHQVRQCSLPVEVILVDSSVDGTARLVAERFPWVRLFAYGERKYPGDARNLGVLQATGGLLAFIDADCVADDHWLSEILKADAAGHLAFGGSVDNGNPDSYVGWAYYFCEFTRWAPGSAAGEMNEIPTCCLAVKRSVFNKFGPFLEGRYCSDTDFNWKLTRAGHRPVFIPAIRVAHLSLEKLGQFLAHEAEHGRAFGELRIAAEEFSRARLWLYVLGAPLLPGVLLARMARRVVANQIYVRRFWAALPAVILGKLAWGWGETSAYAAGLIETELAPTAPAAARSID